MSLFGPPDVEKLKAKGDVKGLIRALGYQKDRAVCDRAAEALGEIGAPAVEPLIAAIKHDDFHSLRDRDPAPGLPTWAEYALGKIGAPAVQPLIAALGDQDTNIAAGLFFGRALVIIGAPAFKPLMAALGDQNKHVREAAAQALGKIGDPRAVEPLIAALKDQDQLVREAAVSALGEIGDARAFEPLSGALRDKDFSVRKKAAIALGKIGDARAVKPLIAVLTDRVEYVRKAAVSALGEIGDPRAVEPLMAALKDQDQDVREAAADALDRIGDAARGDQNRDHVEALIEELARTIGPGLDTTPVARVREIGEELNRIGGMDLMMDVSMKSSEINPRVRGFLGRWWDGVGEWVD